MKHDLHPEQAAAWMTNQFAQDAMRSLSAWPYWVEGNAKADIRCSQPEGDDMNSRLEMWLYDEGVAVRCVGYVFMEKTFDSDDTMTFTIKRRQSTEM